RLEKKIKHLHEQEGVSLEDIVILSSDRLLDCVKKIRRFSLEDVSCNLNVGRRKKVVKYSTIHSFKGLESSVIIIVAGREEVFGDRSRSLLYVSMSRAKSLLIMMIDKRARKGLESRR
ncbi:MAG: ATP-binding domain-containing protein, partial [Candidatus Dadabacteria bacterium]|nr:ATP-binding domain-containing protein [Candidatus Dadabacteria bacterium]